MNEYCFSINNVLCEEGIAHALGQIFYNQIPIIICVGTDASIGDSLGPIVGTMLIERQQPCIVYGSLDKPVTAREISAVKEFVEKVHPRSYVLVIDAAVGKFEDVGTIKVFDKPIKPGLGANKKLPELGDASIIGIIGEKALGGEGALFTSRLGNVYRFASLITDGICAFLNGVEKNGIYQKTI